MATSPFESAALVAAVRRDMAELAAAEFHWERAWIRSRSSV